MVVDDHSHPPRVARPEGNVGADDGGQPSAVPAGMTAARAVRRSCRPRRGRGFAHRARAHLRAQRASASRRRWRSCRCPRRLGRTPAARGSRSRARSGSTDRGPLVRVAGTRLPVTCRRWRPAGKRAVHPDGFQEPCPEAVLEPSAGDSLDGRADPVEAGPVDRCSPGCAVWENRSALRGRPTPATRRRVRGSGVQLAFRRQQPAGRPHHRVQQLASSRPGYSLLRRRRRR